MRHMFLVASLMFVMAAPAFADCDSRSVESSQRKLAGGILSADYRLLETYGPVAATQFADCTAALTGHDKLDAELAQARVLVITARAHLADRLNGDHKRAASMLGDATRLARSVDASPIATQSDRDQAAEVVAEASRFQSRP